MSCRRTFYLRQRARVLKAGAYGFLTKPFSDESLIECLDRALLGTKSDPAS
jgi:FixJ family two-component response regulator